MPVIRGQCSCGAIEYQFSPRSLLVYQCHCSICRKASGSANSTTLMAPESGFSWIRGEERLSSYSKGNGYKICFCSNCGSPMPNKFRNFPLYSVPAGSIEDDSGVSVIARIYLGSRAKWDKDNFEGAGFLEMPILDDMLELLHL